MPISMHAHEAWYVIDWLLWLVIVAYVKNKIKGLSASEVVSLNSCHSNLAMAGGPFIYLLL